MCKGAVRPVIPNVEIIPGRPKTVSFFCQGLEFKVVFHAVDTTQNKVVYEDRSLTVETIPCNIVLIVVAIYSVKSYPPTYTS